MKERSIDRTGWPEGPWDDESDREQWKTDTGLPGLMVRNHMGAWCGYVGVPNDHPYYKVDWSDVPDIYAHGGLTYSALCWDDGPICHIPEPGEPDDVWWLGFDCAHGGDLMPHMLKLEQEIPDLPKSTEGFGLIPPPTYKSAEWVKQAVEDLAEQLAEAAIAGSITIEGEADANNNSQEEE